MLFRSILTWVARSKLVNVVNRFIFLETTNFFILIFHSCAGGTNMVPTKINQGWTWIFTLELDKHKWLEQVHIYFINSFGNHLLQLLNMLNNIRA